MNNYIAKYRTNAYMFDGGAWMPDPEPHSDERVFRAKSSREARKMAEERKIEIGQRYYRARVTLESLFKVEEVV
ncbi:MAG: hypothetical protein AABX65_00770 [Nanoarchaeota archaeon]